MPDSRWPRLDQATIDLAHLAIENQGVINTAQVRELANGYLSYCQALLEIEMAHYHRQMLKPLWLEFANHAIADGGQLDASRTLSLAQDYIRLVRRARETAWEEQEEFSPGEDEPLSDSDSLLGE